MRNQLLMTLVLFVPTLPSAAQAQSTPSCSVIESLPATISTGGNYCLAANAEVNITTGAAVTINSNDVTLDCRDFTITNLATSNAGTSSAIRAVNRNNVQIRNCRLMGGFTDGIYMHMLLGGSTTSFYNRVEDNYIAGPFRYGILAYGSAIEVRGNTIYDVGGQAASPAMGIRVGGSSVSSFKFQVVERNLVAGTNSPFNHAYGIYSDNSIGAMFLNNTISGTYGLAPNYKGYGIRVANGSGVTIRGNIVGGGGRDNEVGIQTPSNGGWCYDNQIRTYPTATLGCDASLGNF
ncbi:right-handed parallel beta-helix repeat-containing protein [Arenimonas terrae]|nr:right-handed parallel beta-helix repeat-containing protein [Arenimonas terrae]